MGDADPALADHGNRSAIADPDTDDRPSCSRVESVAGGSVVTPGSLDDHRVSTVFLGQHRPPGVEDPTTGDGVGNAGAKVTVGSMTDGDRRSDSDRSGDVSRHRLLQERGDVEIVVTVVAE